MDYHRNDKYFRIIIFATLIVLSQCEPADRDIILTPKQSAQIKGKTLYYRPVEDLNNEPGVRVPWERILKHLTYLTLYGMPYDKNQISHDNNVDYKQFMNASYIIQTDGIVTNFGDIITLAEGRVEKPATNNKLQFVEGKCPKQEHKCNDKNIIAEWTVQKIRHRDGDKKFRYEIKFSINRYEKENRDEEVTEGRELQSGKRVTRSFILRDFDYPNSFVWFDQHVSQRRLDENRRYLERLHRFNEIFMQPIYIDSNFYTSDNPIIPQLNLGEFLLNPIQRKSPSYTRFITPTTYRPNYHLKFSKPSLSYEIPVEKGQFSTVATHLHHHFYIADSKYEESPKSYAQHSSGNFASGPTIEPAVEYEIPTPPPIKHQIPIPPNYGNHQTQTALPFQLTSPIIPETPLIYSKYSTPSSPSASAHDFVRNIAQNIFQQFPAAVNPTLATSLVRNLAPNVLQQFPTAASPTNAQDLVRNLAQNVFQNVAQNLGFPFNQPIVPSIQPYVYNYQVPSTPALQQQPYLQQVTPTQTFIESPRYESTRYSEPDPLYRNSNGVTTPDEPQTSLEQNSYYQQQPTVFNQETTSLDQQANLNKQNARPNIIQTELNSYSSEQLSESPTYTYSSIIDTNPKVEKPSAVDQSTEQNQVVESPHGAQSFQTSHTTESLQVAHSTEPLHLTHGTDSLPTVHVPQNQPPRYNTQDRNFQTPHTTESQQVAHSTEPLHLTHGTDSLPTVYVPQNQQQGYNTQDLNFQTSHTTESQQVAHSTEPLHLTHGTNILPTVHVPQNQPQGYNTQDLNFQTPHTTESLQVTHSTQPLHLTHGTDSLPTVQGYNTQDLQSAHNAESLQVPAPSSANSHVTTLPYNESTRSEEYSDSAEASGNREEPTINSSIDHAEHTSPVGSVEVTHFSEPLDPPIFTTETSTPNPLITTTERIVKSVQAFTATSPRSNRLDNEQPFQITKAQAHFKTPSERPVLKWKPKRPRIKTPLGSKSTDDNDPTIIIAKTRIRRPLLKVSTGNESSVTFERVPDQDTIQKIYKIKSSTETDNINGSTSPSNVPTEQSVSTSISIKVGTSDEQPLLPTISIPNVELYKADLERLNTDSKSIKFFKATEKGREQTTSSTEEDQVITRSIVAHATSLGY